MSGAFERQFTNDEIRKLAYDMLDLKRFVVQEHSEDPKGDLCVRLAGVAVKLLGQFQSDSPVTPFDSQHATSATRWQPPVVHYVGQTHI